MATWDQIIAALEKQNKPRSHSSSSSYSFGGSKGGSAPSPGSVVNPKTSKGSTHDGGGIIGELEGIGKNLAHDVKDTVTGFVPGVFQTIHHPIGTAEAIGADYKRRYSPLVHGDFGKFFHQVAQHPLAPLLDVATVATAGGGAAAKLGQSARVAAAIKDARVAGEVSKATKLAEETAPARKAVEALTTKKTKVMADRDAAAERMKSGALDVQKSSARAWAKHNRTISQLQDSITQYATSIRKAEKASSEAHVELPAHIKALVNLQAHTKGGFRYISADKGAEHKTIRVAQFNNPVKRLRQNLGINLQESRFLPQRTPLIGLESRAKKAANLERDIYAGRRRSAQRKVIEADNNMTKVAGKDTALHNDLATATQGLIDGVAPSDYARLVDYTRAGRDEVGNSLKQGLTEDEHHAFTKKLIAPHKSKRANALYQAAQAYEQREALASGRVIKPSELVRADDKLVNSPEVASIVKLRRAHEEAATDAARQLVDNGQLKHDDVSANAVLHTNLIRSLKGEAPRSFEEMKAEYEKAGLPVPGYNPDTLIVEDAGKRTGMLKENKGKVYIRGKQFSPMNIVMRHELASKASDLKHAHDLMLSAARHIPAGERLPKGYVWVKDSLAKDLDQKNALLRNQVEDGKALTSAKDFFDTLSTQKRPEGGFAIKEDVAHDLMAGRKAMTAARAETLTKGITAWKFLVLTRPAFLVHNVISNQLMFHLKKGWGGQAFKNMNKAFESGLFKEHHHSEGLTFSEDVIGKPRSKASKAIGIFYKLTAQHEHWLRQLTAYETIRRMPEFQREMRALKGGKWESTNGKTMFHEAYDNAVAKDPHIRDLVTRNMDDTLGNYRYYTAQERLLKNISPFYGWERHSVRNLIRMMEDNPATMAMITQLGMVGQKKWNKDFGPGMPDFVHTYVEDSYIKTLAQHLGLGNKVDMVDFNSTNPWTTAVDVGKSVTDPKALVSNMGPLVTGPLEALTKKSALTGAPSYSRFDKYSPIAGALDRVITQTPPVTAWDAFTSKKNEKKKMLPASDEQVGLQQSGFDFRALNKKIARKMAKEEAAPKDKYGHVLKKKKVKPFSY
jgi:hypothetical protein